MRKIISTDAARTAIVVGLIIAVLTPFAGRLWPAMVAIWVGWAIVTPLSIRSEVRRAR